MYKITKLDIDILRDFTTADTVEVFPDTGFGMEYSSVLLVVMLQVKTYYRHYVLLKMITLQYSMIT